MKNEPDEYIKIKSKELEYGKKVRVRTIGGVKTHVIYTPVKLTPIDFQHSYHTGNDLTEIPPNPNTIRILLGDTPKKINTLVPELPEDILNYPSVEDIELHNLNIKEFDLLTKMPKLKKITIYRSKIKSIPKDINKLKKLQTLELYWDEDLTEIPDSLYELENLRYLEIRGANLKEISPKIKNLKKLTNIGLGCSGITKLPKETKELTNLYGVDFNCPLRFTEEKFDKELIKSLEDLNLPDTINWLDIDTETFANLKNLKGISSPKAIAHILNNGNSNVQQIEQVTEGNSIYWRFADFKNTSFPDGYRKLLVKCKNDTHNFISSSVSIPDEALQSCKTIVDYDKADIDNCITDLESASETTLTDKQKVCLVKLGDESNTTRHILEIKSSKQNLNPLLKNLLDKARTDLTIKTRNDFSLQM